MSTAKQAVGFIGLGMMGRGMAKHALGNSAILAEAFSCASKTGEARAVSFIGDAVHNTYTAAGNLGHQTQFVPHWVNSLNLLNAATASLA